MRKSTSTFIGLLAVFLTAWIGMILVPYFQIGRLQPDVDDVTKDQTPAAYPGMAEQGRAIYAANGCVYCHSQQIRSRKEGGDLDRDNWGGATNPRRTVARDYLRDRAAYLGFSRLGPDLANVGQRRDKADWLYQHLYEPAVVSPGTNCPPLHFLFDRHMIKGQPSTDAIQARGEGAPEYGREEVVPTYQARSLVAYLLALKRSGYKLPEAPEEPVETP